MLTFWTRILGVRNCANVSTSCAATLSNGKPMGLRSGYSLSLMPQNEYASLHCPVMVCSTCNNTNLEIMTNRSHWYPSGAPRGISICCGHPQPQKLNCSSVASSVGRLVSKSRNVRSNGIVTEDSVDRRVIVFIPCFTTPESIQLYHE